MIVLDENIGVKTIREFYDALKREIGAGDETVIDFSAVDRVDLAVVQVVIAAAREARARGKTIHLKGVNGKVKYQMQLCGLKA